MEHDDIITAIAKLEARQEEQRKWVHEELLSLMENDRMNGEAIIKIEEALTGDDGLRWTVNHTKTMISRIPEDLGVRLENMESFQKSIRNRFWAIVGAMGLGGLSVIFALVTDRLKGP